MSTINNHFVNIEKSNDYKGILTNLKLKKELFNILEFEIEYQNGNISMNELKKNYLKQVEEIEKEYPDSDTTIIKIK